MNSTTLGYVYEIIIFATSASLQRFHLSAPYLPLRNYLNFPRSFWNARLASAVFIPFSQIQNTGD